MFPARESGFNPILHGFVASDPRKHPGGIGWITGPDSRRTMRVAQGTQFVAPDTH